MTNVRFQNNEYILDINTEIKKVKIDNFKNPPTEENITIKSIYTTPLNTDVSVKCKVKSITKEVKGIYTI